MKKVIVIRKICVLERLSHMSLNTSATLILPLHKIREIKGLFIDRLQEWLIKWL